MYHDRGWLIAISSGWVAGWVPSSFCLLARLPSYYWLTVVVLPPLVIHFIRWPLLLKSLLIVCIRFTILVYAGSDCLCCGLTGGTASCCGRDDDNHCC
jgi:hypothetical protein